MTATGYGAAGYLPLTGGEVTGDLTVDGTTYVSGLNAYGPVEARSSLLVQGGEFALDVTDSAAAALASAGTITTAGNTTATVAPTANVTGVIMAAPDNWGATFVLINASAYTITMAAVGTSHVANGVTCVVAANSAMMLVWNEHTSTWYPL